MAGVYQLEIRESCEELKQLLRRVKTSQERERVQVLYLWKTKKAKTVKKAAERLAESSVVSKHQTILREIRSSL